jgi:DNA-binding NarL/FixJ family response regulator
MLVDDERVVRDGLRHIIDDAPGAARVVGEAADGITAQSVAESVQPDVILMDIRMPRCDGIEATGRLLDSGFPGQVLMLTASTATDHLFHALRVGSAGYLLKDVEAGGLLAAIDAVGSGDAVISPLMTRRLLNEFVMVPSNATASVLPSLSRRELQVLSALAHGRSNDEIANELIVAEATVKSHVSRLLQKLGVRDRLQAALLARDAGLG